MKPFTYMKGINVGGWMSQYQDLTNDLSQHLASFITEEDIDRIAQWGADHIRLPFESSAMCPPNLRLYGKVHPVVQQPRHGRSAGSALH